MSTLTKVLIVLLVVLAVAHSAILLAYLSQSQNWKEYALQVETERDTFLAQLNSDALAAEQTKAQLLGQKQALEDQLTTIGNQLVTVKTENTALLAELGRKTAENTSFQQQLTNLNDALKRAQEDAGYATKQLDRVRGTLSKLTADNTLLEKQVAELTRDVAQLEAEIRSDTEQIVFLKSQLRKAQAGTPIVPELSSGAIQPTFASPARPIRGQIIDVNMGQKLATINAGSVAGVTEGTEFTIFFGSNYVGNLEITRVERDQSIGTIVMFKTPVQIGHSVTTSLE